MLPLRDRNPTRRRPWVTLGLVAACLGAFGYELSLGPGLGPFVERAAFVPSREIAAMAGGDSIHPLGLLSGVERAGVSMFLHAGWTHLLGNLLFLWVFGDNVEDRLGPIRFLVFYLAVGYAATAAHAASSPHSAVPIVGASGAISGILGAYLVLHPRAPVQTLLFFGFFFRLVELPAWVFLPLWFALQLLSGVASLTAEGGPAEGVAWFAHIGGFMAGPLALVILAPRARGRRRRRA